MRHLLSSGQELLALQLYPTYLFLGVRIFLLWLNIIGFMFLEHLQLIFIVSLLKIFGKGFVLMWIKAYKYTYPYYKYTIYIYIYTIFIYLTILHRRSYWNYSEIVVEKNVLEKFIYIYIYIYIYTIYISIHGLLIIFYQLFLVGHVICVLCIIVENIFFSANISMQFR